MNSAGCLWQATVRFRRIFFFFVDTKRQIWLTSNDILRKILLFSQAVACEDSVVLEATCTSSGNKQKVHVRHFRKDCVSTFCWKLLKVRGSSVPCYASNQRVHCSVLGLPNETTSSCNQTCVFIWSTYVPNAKSKQATCWHTIFIPYSHTIFIESVSSKIKDSITVNSDTDHLKFNLLKYLLACNWRYLSLKQRRNERLPMMHCNCN